MATRPTAYPGRKIVIFASELASAVGRHRYQSKKETFRKVWLRSHQQSFCFAHALQFKNDLRPILTECEELTNHFPSLKDDIDLVDFASVLRKSFVTFHLERSTGKFCPFLKLISLRATKKKKFWPRPKSWKKLQPK